MFRKVTTEQSALRILTKHRSMELKQAIASLFSNNIITSQFMKLIARQSYRKDTIQNI